MKNIIFLLSFQILLLNITIAQSTSNEKNGSFPKITWGDDSTGFYLISKYSNNIEDTFYIRFDRRIDVKVEGNKCAVLLNTGRGYRYILFQAEDDFNRDQTKKNSSWKIIAGYIWSISASGIFPAKIALLELKSINTLLLKELDTNSTYVVIIKVTAPSKK